MNMLIKKMLAVVLLAAFSLNGTGCVKSYMMHPEFKTRHKDIFSASIVTPEVDAYMLTFKGDKKQLKDVAAIMEQTTIWEMKRVLRKKGYEVKDLDLSEKKLKKDPEMRTTLFNVRKLFNKSIGDIAMRKNKDHAYSIGPDVNVFAEEADCDILIFVKEEGMKKSAGENARGMAKTFLVSAASAIVGFGIIPVGIPNGTVVHIAVVDANDGAILWYANNVTAVEYDPASRNQMSMLIKSLMGQFPKSLNKQTAETRQKHQKESVTEKSVTPVKSMTPAEIQPAAM